MLGLNNGCCKSGRSDTLTFLKENLPIEQIKSPETLTSFSGFFVGLTAEKEIIVSAF